MATLAVDPSASFAPERLNDSAASTIQPSVPVPDFSVEAKISATTSPAWAGGFTVSSNWLMSGSASARSRSPPGATLALRSTGSSTQSMRSVILAS